MKSENLRNRPNSKNRIIKDEPAYCEQNPDLPKAIICDLDGTLALMNGRNPFDASRCDNDLLHHPVANLLKNYKKNPRIQNTIGFRKRECVQRSHIAFPRKT